MVKERIVWEQHHFVLGRPLLFPRLLEVLCQLEIIMVAWGVNRTHLGLH